MDLLRRKNRTAEAEPAPVLLDAGGARGIVTARQQSDRWQGYLGWVADRWRCIGADEVETVRDDIVATKVDGLLYRLQSPAATADGYKPFPQRDQQPGEVAIFEPTYTNTHAVTFAVPAAVLGARNLSALREAEAAERVRSADAARAVAERWERAPSAPALLADAFPGRELASLAGAVEVIRAEFGIVELDRDGRLHVGLKRAASARVADALLVIAFGADALVAALSGGEPVPDRLLDVFGRPTGS